MGLPDDLVTKFRTVALERLERIEAAWEQVLRDLDPTAAVIVHRELHTLKGDSRMVGFADVNLVCHRLEDLVAVARAHGYAVDEDLDLAVNMALRFMTMLVRKRAGTNLGGFDLPGFLRHIDKLLEDAREPGARTRPTGAPPILRSGHAGKLPRQTRDQLAVPAVDAFIEYGAARGQRRNRLRTSWFAL